MFIASRAANSPSIGNAVYSASKGAIISYAKCLALELAPRLIRVNCVCPGMVWTELILQGGISKEDLEQAQLANRVFAAGSMIAENTEAFGIICRESCGTYEISKC